MEYLDTLERRTYETYRSRLEAQKRLSSLNVAWKICLLALSAAPAIASIGLLANDGLYGVAGPALLVALTVFALAVSIAVAERDFGARARGMFASYRAAQRLSAEIEGCQRPVESSTLLRYQAVYQDLLDESENHTQADYDRFTSPGKSSWATRRAAMAVALPYFTLTIPILTLVPFAFWAIAGASSAGR